MRKQQLGVQQIATDIALVEEAMRYGFVLASWGKRVSGSSPPLSLSFDRTLVGEYYDHSRAIRKEI